MADEAPSHEGGCRCGQVRFRVTAAPLLTMACHCRGCQRMTASAFSLSVAIPSKGFAVTQGEPAIGGLHGEHRHFYCPHCKSWLFTRPAGMDFFVNVRPTMIDDASFTTPFIEVCTDEKLPWVTIPAVHSFAGFPPAEAYEGLIGEFMSRAAADGE